MVKNDKKQLEILRFIYDTVEEHGFPPTVREICAAVGLSSTSTVHGHLARLERKGLLIKDATKPRAIEVTTEGRKAIGVSPSKIPMLGTVTNNEDLTKPTQEYFPLPSNLKGYNGDLFMLTIGDDMNKIGILKGDQVIVHKQDTAENGDIALVKTPENKIAVKKLSQKDNSTILGKVVSLYRANI